MLDLSSLPQHSGDLLLITDRIDAPADFVILRRLGPALKQPAKCKTILVSFAQPLSHWTSIAARVVSRMRNFLHSGIYFQYDT